MLNQSDEILARILNDNPPDGDEFNRLLEDTDDASRESLQEMIQ